MRSKSFHLPSRSVAASLIAIATVSLSAVASAQVQVPIYSENFNTGYLVNNQTLSDQNAWTTNDEDTGGTYIYNGNQTGTIGQSDNVGYVGAFSQQTNNYAGALGGVYGQAVAPGIGAGTVLAPTAVTLTHALPTVVAPTLTFSTDFQVTNPSVGLPAHDTFGLSLRGASGALITINFRPDANNTNNFDNITYTAGAANAASTGFGINLGTNTRYKLTVSVNITAATFSASYQGESANGTLTGSAIPLVANAAYAGGAITAYGATWSLQDTAAVTTANNPLTAGTNALAHTDAGSNVLYFDNVLVTVPEPSTYAMVGLGAFGLMTLVRRNRRARLA